MNEKPLVSILTNTYNRSELIHRCIESIQRQTYSNYEHIIVDGNSTDNTKEVVESYNDPHIKYIKLNTRGPQIQMEAGSKIAKGKYVTFLDDDDEYLPDKIEKQVNLFEQEPEDIGVVYCWMTYYRNDNPNNPIKIHKTELKGFVGDIAPSSPLISGTPTMMIRLKVFKEYGGTFDDSIGIPGSDWELMSRICQKYKVDYVPESLVKVYVDHGYKRLSTDFYQDKARKSIKFHKHFLNVFSSVFNRYPQYAAYHYRGLGYSYAKLKDRKTAYKYWKLYAKYSKDNKSILMLLYHIIIGK